METLTRSLRLSEMDSKHISDTSGIQLASQFQQTSLIRTCDADQDYCEADTDDSIGYLRIRVIDAEDLPRRADGSATRPYVMIAVNEFTRRRVRRSAESNQDDACVFWGNRGQGEVFDFDHTNANAQIVIDCWDRPCDDVAPALLGKIVVPLTECSPGVPHTFFRHLLWGKMVID